MNRTIFITGSTDGIGKLAAILLAKDGHTIYLHGRNATKLSRVIAEVKQLANNDNIKGFTADFSDLNVVRQLATKIKAELPKIDILINNAGIFKSAITYNKDGLDIRYVVNYLAPYILTNELLPLLHNGVSSRIINLSSAAQDPLSYEALRGEEKQSERATYGQSKLALTMWSFHLAKKEPEIAVIAVNPGSLLNTNMVREAFGQHWSSADKGAVILHQLAVSEQYNGITGQYFDNDQGAFGKAHSDAYDESKIDKLISTTANILAN